MRWFALIALVTCVRYVRATFQLQILHTNDMHARFDEVDRYTAPCTPTIANEGQCYGGFARIYRKAIVAKAEAVKRNISSVYLNAGDTFQGTPYYTVYKWRIAAALMNSMGFDAMCLGNHEFDDGINNLVQYLTHTKIPTVTANLNLTSDGRLNETNIKPSVIMERAGVKIGIVGYLTPDTMMTSKTENLKILDEIASLKVETKRLKERGAKIIIGLGHSGLITDKKIAAEVELIDIIVGGHSHSLLYNAEDGRGQPSTEKIIESYPYWVTQKSGKRVPIVQSSAYTKYFGKLLVTFDDNWKVTSAEGNSHLLDNKHIKDENVDNQVNLWTAELRKRLQTVVGNTRVTLYRDKFDTKLESNLGNLITDAFFDKGVSLAKEKNSSQWTEHTVTIYQAGGIRSSIGHERNDGNITVEDILTVLPFQNVLHQCRLTGAELNQLFEHSVHTYDFHEKNLQYLLYFSGVRLTYDLKKAPNNRLNSIKVLCSHCSVPKYEPLQANKTYTIILNEFLLRGGDSFTIFPTSCKDVKSLELTDADTVIDYIQKQKIIYPILDGRLEVHGYGEPSMAARTKVSFNLYLLAFILAMGIAK